MQAKSASNIKVIDVSHHQGSIDWKKVKADGVQGVFIKATEGGSMIDLKLSSNAVGSTEAGLKVGYYHYAHPELNAPETEAANFYRNIKQYRADFPHVLDVEGDAALSSRMKLTDWCLKWLQEVEKLSGHKCMIYTGAYFARDHLGAALGKYPLWVAHYGQDKPLDNSTWSKWSVFQYADDGKVAGIAGDVDMNAMEESFFNPAAIPQPSAADNIKVVVNDVLATYGRVENGRVFVPLRGLGEAIGEEVHWDAKTSTPYIRGLAVPEYITRDGKTYVKITTVAALIKGTVKWDEKTKKVYVYRAPN
jgi:lysozyme